MEILALALLVIFSYFFTISMMVNKINKLKNTIRFLEEQRDYYYDAYLVEYQKGVTSGYNKGIEVKRGR